MSSVVFGTQEREKSMRKNSIIARVAVLALAIASISSFAACKNNEASAVGKVSTEVSVEVDEAKEALYNEAVKSLQIGNADNSLAAFEAVADYKDAAAYVETIKKYQEAVAAANAFDYEKATSLLSECGKLFDSKGRLDDYAAVVEMSEKLVAGDLEGAKEAKSKIKTLPKKELTAAEMHAKNEALSLLAANGDTESLGALLVDVMSHKVWVSENWGEGEVTEASEETVLGIESRPAVSVVSYGLVSVFFEDAEKTSFYYGVDNGESTFFFDAEGAVIE